MTDDQTEKGSEHQTPRFPVHRSLFLVPGFPFIILRSPFPVPRSPFLILRSSFSVLRSPFLAPRSWLFTVARNSVFVPHYPSPFLVLYSPFLVFVTSNKSETFKRLSKLPLTLQVNSARITLHQCKKSDSEPFLR